MELSKYSIPEYARVLWVQCNLAISLKKIKKWNPLSIPSPEYASIPWKFFNLPINFKNKMESSKSSIPRVLLEKFGCTGTSLSILQINMEPSKYYIPRVRLSPLGILQLCCQFCK